MPDRFHVPAVDITPFTCGGTPDERAETIRKVDHACSTVGFMQIYGHAIPDATIAGLVAAMDSFFGLDAAVKNEYRIPGVNRGYTPPKTESLSLSAGVESANRMNDFFEAFNVGTEHTDVAGADVSDKDYAQNIWPPVPEFRSAVDAYRQEAARVAHVLTDIFAHALGQPTTVFTDVTDHSLDVLRMNNYALPPGTVDLDGDLTGMGEHTDFGFLTVLWADREAGLQVLGVDRVWHDVMPDPGALLVNLGDLTARMTNDRWMSTLHRVKPPIVDGTIRRRRSAAFFHDGNIDATIYSLPLQVGQIAAERYGPISVREHIRAKLAGTLHGKLNVAAVNEARRVQAAAGDPANPKPSSSSGGNAWT